MLTAEIIFDYVWLHFVSVFPEARNLPVAYGAADPQARVAVPASALTFFEKKLAFPEEVFWLEWDEKNLPLFAPPAAAGLLHQTENQVTIGADIIGAAFYFLSGWQEYYSQVRDKFGRYPYRESLQFRHGFVTVPVVNYYFDILKTALEKGYGISLKNPE
ncbi:MAG TPA: hypothetical protein VK927_11675, partial [Adhaeribacter sp.]|nr:hypothetical protein [Adhaeribacter sp.]